MNPIFDYIQRNRVLAIIEKAQCSKARNITLEDFDLTRFPDILLNCPHLYYLNVRHNNVSYLPCNIAYLKNLRHLSLEYNNFDKFPLALRNLTFLVSLNINHNPIGDLSAEIGSLVSLEILWCNGCRLSRLPEEIGKLTKLETLGARHNQICLLPECFGNLKNLRWLTLEDNILHNVPRSFEKLQLLIHLNFSKNNFSFIPFIITRLKSLRYLHFQNNEFFCLPEKEIFELSHTKINLQNNPLQVEDNKVFTNVVITGNENDILDIFGHDSDSSSDDWDNSLDSSDLNYSATESDSDNEEVLSNVPQISKYLTSC